jgi:hypothetical protein
MIPKPFSKCQFLLQMRTINFQCKIFLKTGKLLITTQHCSKLWSIHVTQHIRSLRGNSENFVINSELVWNLITKTYSFLNVGFFFPAGRTHTLLYCWLPAGTLTTLVCFSKSGKSGWYFPSRIIYITWKNQIIQESNLCKQ